jgi:hypothetical protein
MAQRAGLRLEYRHGHRKGDQVVRVYRRVDDRTIMLSQDTYRAR